MMLHNKTTTTASKGKKNGNKTHNVTTTTSQRSARRDSIKGVEQDSSDEDARRSIKRTNSRRGDTEEHHDDDDNLPKSPAKRRSSLDMTVFQTSPPTTRSKSTTNNNKNKPAAGFFTPPWNNRRASLSKHNAKGFPPMPSFVPPPMLHQPLAATSSSFGASLLFDDTDFMSVEEDHEDESNSVASSSSPNSNGPRVVSQTNNAVAASSKKSLATTTTSKTLLVTPKGSPVPSSPDAVASYELSPDHDDGRRYLAGYKKRHQPSFDKIFNSWELKQADDYAPEIRLGKNQEASFQFHPPNVFFEKCVKAKVAELRKIPSNKEKRQMAQDFIHAMEHGKGLIFTETVDPLAFDGVDSIPLAHDQAMVRVLERLRHHLAEDSKRRTQKIENQRLRDEHLLTPQEKGSLEQLALLQKGQVEKAIALITIPDFDQCLEECQHHNRQVGEGQGNVAANKEPSSSNPSGDKKNEPTSPPRNCKKKAGVGKKKKTSASPPQADDDDDDRSIELAVSPMTDAVQSSTTTTATSGKVMRANKLRAKLPLRKGKRPAKNSSNNDNKGTGDVAAAGAVPDAIGSTNHSSNNSNNNNNNNNNNEDLVMLAEEMGNCSMTSFEDDMSFFDEASLVRSFSGGSWASNILANAPCTGLSHC